MQWYGMILKIIRLDNWAYMISPFKKDTSVICFVMVAELIKCIYDFLNMHFVSITLIICLSMNVMLCEIKPRFI